MRTLALGIATALLAACAVGPDFVRPTPDAPARFANDRGSVETPASATNASTAAVDANATSPSGDDAFWVGFHDSQLSTLITTALSANHDLRIALANYDRANALLRGAKFDYLPTVTANATAGTSRSSADQLPGIARADRDADSDSVGISAAWELDLFGRIRRNVEANRAGTAANADDLRAAQVAIVGDVASSYVELRGLQERLRVAEENVANQRETLRLVDARLDAGRDSEFDTARARAQVESTLARIPALQAQIAVSTHRIAVLTGQRPDALIATLGAREPLPALPLRIDPGAPGELLRRRPDVAAAEARLHAATARIGVATADLFPRFTLGGLLGSQAAAGGDLFHRDAETHMIALGIDWSFLDVGRVRARIAASDADAAGELARYQQAVLHALEDTENALVRYDRAREEDGHLEHAALDSARAAELARIRFEAGSTGLLDVLDAERTRLQAQDAFADSRTRSVGNAVALYRALAGGWPQTLPLREAIGKR